MKTGIGRELRPAPETQEPLDLLAKEEEKLTFLDSQLTKSSATNRGPQVNAERVGCLEQIARHKKAICVMDNIPPEMLMEIFSWYKAMLPIQRFCIARKDILTLGWVSQTWRNVTLKMPSLWDELEIFPPLEKKEWAVYSQHSLQWLDKGVGSNNLTVSIANPKALSSISASRESVLEFAVLALGPHFANVVNLYMNLLPKDSNGEWHPISFLAPRLRHLTLDDSHFGVAQYTDIFKMTTLPLWSQLTTLDVGKVLLAPTTCHEVLAECGDNLVHCSLRVSGHEWDHASDDPRPNNTMQSLKLLFIDFVGADVEPYFFQSLTLPSLKDLTLYYDCWDFYDADEIPWGIDEFMNFRTRSNLDLESMNISWSTINVQEAIRFLKDMPSLKKVTISDGPQDVDFDLVQFLAALTIGPGQLAPRLEEFSMDRVNDKNLEALTRMAQSRRYPPVEGKQDRVCIKGISVRWWSVKPSADNEKWCRAVREMKDGGMFFNVDRWEKYAVKF